MGLDQQKGVETQQLNDVRVTIDSDDYISAMLRTNVNIYEK